MVTVALVCAIILLVFTFTLIGIQQNQIKGFKKQIVGLKDALESKREADKKRENDKTEPGRRDPEELLVNSLVIKVTKTRMGRSLTEYKLSDKMPEFGTLEEVFGFGYGLTSEMSDPTILNLLPYGNVMKSDDFFAFKIVMQAILTQIQKLIKKD